MVYKNPFILFVWRGARGGVGWEWGGGGLSLGINPTVRGAIYSLQTLFYTLLRAVAFF